MQSGAPRAPPDKQRHLNWATKTAIEKMGGSRFFPFDLRDGKRMNHHSVVSFMPLFAPGIDHERASRVVESLRRSRHCTEKGCLLVPSYNMGTRDFSGRLYWRGPLWVNTNWVLPGMPERRGDRHGG